MGDCIRISSNASIFSMAKLLKFAKPKKVKRKTLRNKADKLFSAIIRRVGYCEFANKDTIHCGGPLQCAHIETRGNYAIRWRLENALCLCGGHHWWYTNHEKKWQEMIKKWFPIKWKFYEKHKNDENTETYEDVIARLEKL